MRIRCLPQSTSKGSSNFTGQGAPFWQFPHKRHSSASKAEYKALIKEFKLDEQKKVTREFPIEDAIEEIVSKSGAEKNK